MKHASKISAVAVGAALVSLSFSNAAAADEGPFLVKSLKLGYQFAAADTTKNPEGKCGEGKCGGQSEVKKSKSKEGKCGEGKCGASAGAEKKTREGKCGEAKCGATASPKSKAAEGKCGEGKCGGKR